MSREGQKSVFQFSETQQNAIQKIGARLARQASREKQAAAMLKAALGVPVEQSRLKNVAPGKRLPQVCAARPTPHALLPRRKRRARPRRGSRGVAVRHGAHTALSARVRRAGSAL